MCYYTIMIKVAVLLVTLFVEASADRIITSFDYDECTFTMGGPYPCRATYQAITDSGDTLLLRTAKLRDYDAARRVMVIDEVRIWRQGNHDSLRTQWTVERDLYGKLISESTDFGTEDIYRTTFEYATSPGQTPFPDLPFSSTTVLLRTGEIVHRGVVLMSKQSEQDSVATIRLKVTIYQNGQLVAEGIERRDPHSGVVIDVESASDSFYASGVVPWWPSWSFGWSVGSSGPWSW